MHFRAWAGWGGEDGLKRLAKSYVRSALRSYTKTIARRPKLYSNFHRDPNTKKDTFFGELPDRPSRTKYRPSLVPHEDVNHDTNRTEYRDEAWGDADARMDLETALSTLDPAEREIFERHHLRGEQINDIAKSLGCNRRTVSRSLDRSMDILREKFGDS